jgi:hypothetical protein
MDVSRASASLSFLFDLSPLFSFQIETMIRWPILTVNMISVRRRNAEKTNFECWFHPRTSLAEQVGDAEKGKFIHTKCKMIADENTNDTQSGATERGNEKKVLKIRKIGCGLIARLIDRLKLLKLEINC